MTRHWFPIIFSLFVLLNFSSNASAQPPAPNPVSPQGAIAESSPEFTWAAVPDALFYLLFVQDTNGVLHSNWHSATDAGCDSGAGNCTINPALSLDDIPKEWAVMAWNNLGTSPLSAIMSFFVGAPHITSAVKNNQSIEINGTHLHTGTDPTVNLGGTALTVTAKNPNGEQVTAELPPDAESGAYELTVAHENGSAKIDFNLTLTGIPGLIIKDANGNKIGDVIDLTHPSQTVLVRLPVVLSNNETRYVGFTFQSNGPYVSGGTPYFESADCSGTPYIDSFLMGGDLFHPASVEVMGRTLNDPLHLYVSTSSTPVDFVSESHISNEFTYQIPGFMVIEISTGLIAGFTDTPQNQHGGQWGNPSNFQFIDYASLNLPLGCKPINPLNRTGHYPAELVDTDLGATYPPPYSLEEQ